MTSSPRKLKRTRHPSRKALASHARSTGSTAMRTLWSSLKCVCISIVASSSASATVKPGVTCFTGAGLAKLAADSSNSRR